jgi:NADP-dependent 3-hydroxy acid dehydrogenase YdfG
MNTLKNKVAVITGGGQGLGEAITLMLAKEGATVIPVDIKEEKVKQVARQITDNRGEAEAMTLDVTNENQIEEVIKTITKKYKTIDILINNAGMDVEPKPLEEYTSKDFDRVVGVNLRGPFLLCRQVLPLMYAKNSGHIINICSTAALRTWPNAVLYHISKAALRGLGWSLFTEIREKKSDVRVSSIIPGGMKTAHVVERFPDMDFSWLQDPQSVAETVKFVLLQPEKTTIPEILAIPPLEWSLP